MVPIIIFLFLIIRVNSVSICDGYAYCVCGYANDVNHDLVGEKVNCRSTDKNILKTKYELPPMAYSFDLSSNRLDCVNSSMLLKSTTLLELYLNDNLITHIEVNSLQFPELKKLDLSNNELSFIHSDVLKSVNKLEYLNLAKNKFTTFSSLTFHHLGNLNEIILDHNNLGNTLQEHNLFANEGFGLTHKIQSLSISGIRLSDVPDNFFADPYDLKRLTISHNNITTVFEIPYTLEYLDISDNPISVIYSEDFLDLPALKELKMNHLLIQEIPDYAFEGLHALKRLEVERNHNLTQFNKFAFGRQVLDDADDFTLEKLSLQGSRLSKLDKELKEPFGRLIELNLQGNPWECDCYLIWLKDLQISKDNKDNLRCASPRTVYNRKLYDVAPDIFVCPITRHLTGAAIGIIALCVCLSFIALWIFVYIPRFQSKGKVPGLFTNTAAYSALPIMYK